MNQIKESNSSDFRVDIIQNEWPGILGMAMAPGKNYYWSSETRNLTKDILKIKDYYKMDVIISLLGAEEMQWLGISNEFKECSKVGIIVQNYPIDDMGTPDDLPKFKELVQKIVEQYLKKGKRVMIHCQGGNGRTGLLVAACFIYQGYSSEQSIKKVRTVRKYAIETNKQKRFIQNLKF